MRRLIIALLALLLISGMGACSQTNTDQPGSVGSKDIGTSKVNTNGDGSPTTTSVTLSAKIMDINGISFLAANMAKEANSADIYWINADKPEVIGASGSKLKSDVLKVGMLVDIVYDGTVMESFPMGLGGVRSIRIMEEEGGDIAGLYQSVIKDLYETDEGLNSGIKCIAFDFSGISNLTETEKTALVYSLGNTYGLETIRGTFDELCEQGYIDKEKLSFETGLLFTIKVSAMEKDRFTFDANKWRGGDGADFYNDCTAKKAKGRWTYTIGSSAIS
jgi:hypothetical protein